MLSCIMYVTEKENNIKVQVEIIKIDKSHIGVLSKEKFRFDWIVELEQSVFALKIIESKEIIGLMAFEIIHEELRLEIKTLELSKNNIGKNKMFDRIAGVLIAYACKTSFQLGFFGFVSLLPKTQLIGHYKNKYGFEQYGRQLAIDFEKSEYLIDEYLQKK